MKDTFLSLKLSIYYIYNPWFEIGFRIYLYSRKIVALFVSIDIFKDIYQTKKGWVGSSVLRVKATT